MPIIYAVIVLFIVYTALIFYYHISWNSIPLFVPDSSYASIKISVIISARNEEENIAALLKALTRQSYASDLTEIIVVDDHSTDGTAEIVSQFPQVKLMQLTDEPGNSYKKKAIEKGIGASTGDLIVTTDADCIPLPRWLENLAKFREKSKAVFIAAPVSFVPAKKSGLSSIIEPQEVELMEFGHSSYNSILYGLQELDFIVLQGITGASVYKNIHSMCNGANLAYDKKVYYEVKGFEGIDNIASGDDMLLMHKIWKKYPTAVRFLKSQDAIVFTQPMKTWKSFFNQRIRWASKATYYKDWRIFCVLLLVYLFNLSFLVLFIAGFFNYGYWIWLAALWAAKTIIEIPFVHSVARFFGKQSLLYWFFFFQPLHILYTIISGLFGQFGKYEWKGRRVK
jgi:biofilm PGA synthesis N-glycosyltransferase PgaC